MSETSKGGAPRGNRNRMRHGLHSARLPKKCRYIEHSVNRFRRQLEDEILARDDAVTVFQAALIQSAMRHERRAQLCERWLREAEEKLTRHYSKTSGGETSGMKETSGLSTMDRVGLMREISNASDSRDKCLERLGLDKRTGLDPWAVLDAQTPAGRHRIGQADTSVTKSNGEAHGES